MNVFHTRSPQLAACFRYCLGPTTHLSTHADAERGFSFAFDNESEECRGIARAFYAEDGFNGYAVSDAKALLEEFRHVRDTMTYAFNDANRIWTNEQR